LTVSLQDDSDSPADLALAFISGKQVFGDKKMASEPEGRSFRWYWLTSILAYTDFIPARAHEVEMVTMEDSGGTWRLVWKALLVNAKSAREDGEFTLLIHRFSLSWLIIPRYGILTNRSHVKMEDA
jgi:hypothetical protein